MGLSMGSPRSQLGFFLRFPIVIVEVLVLCALAGHDSGAMEQRAPAVIAGWGTDADDGQNVPEDLTLLVTLDAGFSEIAPNSLTRGRAIAWGRNINDQSNPPAGLTNMVGVYSSAIGIGNYAIRSDGSVVSWAPPSGRGRPSQARIRNRRRTRLDARRRQGSNAPKNHPPAGG